MILGMPCLFHWLTGWYCPGCGGTRALVYLMHGQVGRSVHYHPLVLYLLAVLLIQMSGLLLAKVRHNPRLLVGHINIFAYVGAGIVVINCLVKNYMLIIRGIDMIP